MHTKGISFTFLAIFLFGVAIYDYHPFLQDVSAIGTWNGQNTLHVPISWCAVQGSPAVANPNLNGDTTTDTILWRRHERPTDNIYVNPSGITFRSAINSVWGTGLTFPIIADPDTTLATQGDMNGWNVNVNGVEFNQLINNCDAVWAAPPYNRAGIGVTAVNAGLFHDNAGNYVGVIGWGGCTQSSTTGTCVSPYDGRIVLVDNHYLFPGVPNRTFPGTTTQFTLTDPLDQLAGHELGHSLALPHRSLSTALMNPTVTDNNGDSQVDNIGLNAAEITTLRASALQVPGLEQDPPGKIIPGDIAASRKVDKVQEKKNLPAYLDLSSVRITLDTKLNEISIDQQLFGLIPEKAKNLQYWTLVDADNDKKTGAGDKLLASVGVPSTKFNGADMVILAEIGGKKITGSVWQFKEGNLVKLKDGFKFDLQTLVMHPYYAAITQVGDGFPVHDIVNVKIQNGFTKIDLGQKFNVQVIAFGKTVGKIPVTTSKLNDATRLVMLDKLDDTQKEQGVQFILERPSFPHCFPHNDVRAGETVKIDLDGLIANSKIHGLLGPQLVFNGETNSEGGGTIDFNIPKDAREGLHLVTIGVDGTALTADCVVNVIGNK